MSRSRGPGWGVLVVALVVVAGGVVIWARRSEPARVLVIGDSLTVLAEGAGLKHPGWVIDARSGRATPEGIDVARRRHADRYPVVIVALGTNDRADDAVVFGRLIDDMMRVLGRSPEVIWVNADSHTPQLRPSRSVNQALAVAPARHPNLRVADWNTYVTTVKGFGSMRAGDGIHYDQEGSALRAKWMLALDRG